jgi:hypothetical protein
MAFNRYAYTYQNPINFIDPTGHCIFGIDTIVCVIAAGAVIGAGVGYVAQVHGNLQDGMELGDALSTDISAGPIVGGAMLGGTLAGTGAIAATVIAGATTSGGAAIAGTTAATAGTAAATAAGTNGFDDELLAAQQLASVGLRSSQAPDLIRRVLNVATRRAGTANEAVIGRYDPSGVNGYIQEAGRRGATYFSTNAWAQLGNTANRWAVNQQFLKDQLLAGRTIRLVSMTADDVIDLLDDGSMLFREVQWLMANAGKYGYVFDEIEQVWRLVSP